MSVVGIVVWALLFNVQKIPEFMRQCLWTALSVLQRQVTWMTNQVTRVHFLVTERHIHVAE
jgi:hypothetical protein